MEAEKTCECGMPLNEQTACACQPNLCKHCCTCDPGCSCNCSAVDDDEETVEEEV